MNVETTPDSPYRGSETQRVREPLMDVSVVDPRYGEVEARLQVWANNLPSTPDSAILFTITTVDEAVSGFCRFADQAWQEFLATCDELGLDVDMRA